MAKTSKFWAGACAGLTMPFAAVGGALKGGYDATRRKRGCAHQFVVCWLRSELRQIPGR